MFIQTETTPNPLTLKFLPGVDVLGLGTAFYTSAEAARKASPLAGALFGIEGVTAIFLGRDFITVTRAENAGWEALKPHLLSAIMEHFVAGRPVLSQKQEAASDNGDDSELVRQIKELIETRVRPAVAQDGGDIIYRDFDEASGVVTLELHGACSGCPSSTYTLKQGIENMLRHYVPEVTSVEAVA